MTFSRGNLQRKLQALALQIVIQCLLANADSYALWIDTSGDFSAEKTAQLVRHFDIAVNLSSTSWRESDEGIPGI
jgi:hypothetical protein